MKTGSVLFRLLLAALLIGALAAPQARADSRRGNIRSLGSINRSASNRAPGRPLRMPASTRSGRTSDRRQPSLDGLRTLGNLLEAGRYGYGNHDGYRDYGRRYHDYDRRYRDYDRRADAIRDAAIINGVVNMVGIIASTAAQPVYAPQPCPAPPVMVQPAPVCVAPRYRIERVLVRPAHYEEYQVWVPDAYDPRTGEIIKGHYVIRQRYVPDLWEERQVPY